MSCYHAIYLSFLRWVCSSICATCLGLSQSAQTLSTLAAIGWAMMRRSKPLLVCSLYSRCLHSHIRSQRYRPFLVSPHASVDDFRFTACVSLLKCVKAANDERGGQPSPVVDPESSDPAPPSPEVSCANPTCAKSKSSSAERSQQPATSDPMTPRSKFPCFSCIFPSKAFLKISYYSLFLLSMLLVYQALWDNCRFIYHTHLLNQQSWLLHEHGNNSNKSTSCGIPLNNVIWISPEVNQCFSRNQKHWHV